MIKYSILFLLLTAQGVSGQVNPGPRITALGSSGVALQDVWNLQANQAGIAAQKKFTAAAAYESEFFNPDLSRQSAVILYPYNNNTFGLSFQNYGFSVYNEQKIAFAYARNFGNTVFAAINFNFHQLQIQKYGGARTYSVEAGLQYLLNEKLIFGAHIANPNRSSYNEQVNAIIPVSIEFGMSYRFTENVLFHSGIIKTLNSNIDVKTGVEYSFADWLDIRGGFSVNPFRHYAGFGFKCLNLHIDAAVSSHVVLGYSPQLGLNYEF